MKQAQKGFAALEGILILVIVGLIGFAGWYVYHSKNVADKSYSDAVNSSPSTSPSKKKVYTNPTKQFSFTYPSGWTLDEFGVGIPDGQQFEYLAAVSTSLIPPNPSWDNIRKDAKNVVYILGYKSAAITDIMAKFGAHAPMSETINGYTALYQQVNTAVATEDVYGISNKETTVIFSFREKQSGNPGPSGEAAALDDTKYVPDFKSMVHSIKFTDP